MELREISDLLVVALSLGAFIFLVVRALASYRDQPEKLTEVILDASDQYLWDPEIIARLEELAKDREMLKSTGQSLVQFLTFVESLGVTSEISDEIKRYVLELIDDIPFANKEMGLHTQTLVTRETEAPKD